MQVAETPLARAKRALARATQAEERAAKAAASRVQATSAWEDSTAEVLRRHRETLEAKDLELAEAKARAEKAEERVKEVEAAHRRGSNHAVLSGGGVLTKAAATTGTAGQTTAAAAPAAAAPAAAAPVAAPEQQPAGEGDTVEWSALKWLAGNPSILRTIYAALVKDKPQGVSERQYVEELASSEGQQTIVKRLRGMPICGSNPEQHRPAATRLLTRRGGPVSAQPARRGRRRSTSWRTRFTRRRGG